MRIDPADIQDLAPLIAAAVRATLADIEASERRFDGRLAFTEAEAAGLLGVARHTLRDCRLRGEIVGKLCGKKILYSRDALSRFLTDT